MWGVQPEGVWLLPFKATFALHSCNPVTKCYLPPFSTQAQADLTQEVITKGIRLSSHTEPQKSLPVRLASPSSWVCLPEKAVSNLHFVPPRLGPSHPDKRT